jgi:hypothetical protein
VNILTFDTENAGKLANKVILCNFIKKCEASSVTDECIKDGETWKCCNDINEITPSIDCAYEYYGKRNGVVNKNSVAMTNWSVLNFNDVTGKWWFKKPSDADLLIGVVYDGESVKEFSETS